MSEQLPDDLNSPEYLAHRWALFIADIEAEAAASWFEVLWAFNPHTQEPVSCMFKPKPL